ncbi:MAG: hypothetical protein WCI72_00605 [archaeon]
MGIISAKGKDGLHIVIDTKKILVKKPKAPKEHTSSPVTQEDHLYFAEKNLELCPYLRNPTIDRENKQAYGSCALTEFFGPCARNKIDTRGKPECYRYNQLWKPHTPVGNERETDKPSSLESS